MADSLSKVGGFELFDLEPDWAEDITHQHSLSRILISYPGTPTQYEANNATEVPMALNLNFRNTSKAEEYALLDFFASKMGRHTRWWLKNPSGDFFLKASSAAGVSGVYCELNHFDKIYQGFERIYIQMLNTDIIVRKVTTCTSGYDYTYLELDSALDRTITLDNVVQVGRLLLVRFDVDKMRVKYYSNRVSSVQIRVAELVKEYALAD